MHKRVNVLNCLPKASQPKAKQGLHEIWMAEAERAFDDFLARYEAKYPKVADRAATTSCSRLTTSRRRTGRTSAPPT